MPTNNHASVRSPLGRSVTRDGTSVRVEIYRDGAGGWLLEVVGQSWNSTVGDAPCANGKPWPKRREGLMKSVLRSALVPGRQLTDDRAHRARPAVPRGSRPAGRTGTLLARLVGAPRTRAFSVGYSHVGEKGEPVGAAVVRSGRSE